MTNALAIEAAMLHPRYMELVEHLRALTPVDLLDQADAAAADALNILSALGAIYLDRPAAMPTTAADLPAWLRLSVLDALASWANGTSSTCMHTPDPRHPQPVLSAAWKPRLVVCTLCPRLLAEPRGSVKDRTCDACGHICAGVDLGDGVWPGMVQLGPLIHQYGTCTACRPPMPQEA